MDQAAKGEPFIIAKAGKPVVCVVAVDSPRSEKARRLGFLKGYLVVPDDFDEMAADIAGLLEGRR